MPKAWTRAPAPAVRAETTWNSTPMLADSGGGEEITDHAPPTQLPTESFVEPSSNMTGAIT